MPGQQCPAAVKSWSISWYTAAYRQPVLICCIPYRLHAPTLAVLHALVNLVETALAVASQGLCRAHPVHAACWQYARVSILRVDGLPAVHHIEPAAVFTCGSCCQCLLSAFDPFVTEYCECGLKFMICLQRLPQWVGMHVLPHRVGMQVLPHFTAFCSNLTYAAKLAYCFSHACH